jgi:hypothetical protein
MATMIIYGPGRCGKSHHKKALAAAFNCKTIVEDWVPGDRLTRGALHLTNIPMKKLPRDVSQLSFQDCITAGIIKDDRTVQDDGGLKGPAS